MHGDKIFIIYETVTVIQIAKEITDVVNFFA